MKKTLLALAALTAFAGAASAQSSVTLFGVVDLGLRNTKNNTLSLKTLTGGSNTSSRLGFRGIEDLGGGLRAGFWIEGDLVPDTGNPAGMSWARRSTVSLMGGFGEIRLGRDYLPSFSNLSAFDVFGYIGPGGISNLLSTLGSSADRVRASNSIGYHLPAMGGIYGNAMVSANEGPAAPWNKYVGARVGYAGGPVNVAVAFGNTDRGTAPDYKHMNAGASYNLGFMSVMGLYSKYKVGSTDQTTVSGGFMVPMGAGTFKASYIRATGSDNSLKANLMAVGYVYDLSKRTALYTTLARVSNGGNSATGAKFTAGAAGPTMALGGKSSTAYDFGLRHSF